VVAAPVRTRSVLAALRPAHWSKNFLVFLPLVLHGDWDRVDSWVRAAGTFAAMCLAASSLYLLNDLRDAGGRQLLRRPNPVEDGGLGRRIVWRLAAVLFAAALVVSVPFQVTPWIAGYGLLSGAYTWRLKELAVIDLLALGSLYLLRLEAGGAATGIPVTDWTRVVCGGALFSMALVKRVAELRLAGLSGLDRIPRRAYTPSDARRLMTAGLMVLAAAVVAFLVFLQQFGGPQGLNRRGWALVAGLIATMWALRMWRLAWMGRMRSDPVVFTLSDRTSWIAVLAGLAAYILAIE
jgi:4-hydroxybenzoate polyprenyltransferase